MITVIDVCRSLGIEPTPDLTWEVGASVRDRFEQIYGCPPIKALREKTNGPGSHCFAIYPEAMRSTIADIIRSHQTETARQFDMFREAAE